MTPYFVTHVEMKDADTHRATVPLWLEIGVRNLYGDKELEFTVQIRMSRKDPSGYAVSSKDPHVWLWKPDAPTDPWVYTNQEEAMDVLESWLKGQT